MRNITLADNFPRINCPTLEELKAVGETMPFVITGVVPNWPAYTKWSLDYLQSEYGDLAIKVRDKRTGVYKSRKDFLLHPGQPMTFAEYIETIVKSNDPQAHNYYMFEQNPNYFPGLSQDFSVPPYIAQHHNIQGFWVSCKNAYTHLHYDLGHNFLAQVAGQKTLILLRPNLSCMYPYPRNGASQVDLHNPDYQTFPNFKYTQPLVCNLKAGEILYLPSCWWHQVHSVADVNISVNFFWQPSLGYKLNHIKPLWRPHKIRLYDFIENSLAKFKLG